MSEESNGTDAVRCPSCGYKIDTHVATPGNAPRPPETGDALVCEKCHKVALYTADNTLRKPTAAELLDIRRLHPELEDLIDGSA
jgi:hypothetical protein